MQAQTWGEGSNKKKIPRGKNPVNFNFGFYKLQFEVQPHLRQGTRLTGSYAHLFPFPSNNNNNQ